MCRDIWCYIGFQGLGFRASRCFGIGKGLPEIANVIT